MNLQLLSAKHQLDKLKKKEYRQGTVQINYTLDFSSLGYNEQIIIPIICSPELADDFLQSIKNNKIINERI